MNICKIVILLFSGVDSVKMESLFSCRHEQSFPHDLLWRVVWKLEVVHARVHRRVGAVAGVDLPDDRQTRKQIGEAAWNQITLTF